MESYYYITRNYLHHVLSSNVEHRTRRDNVQHFVLHLVAPPDVQVNRENPAPRDFGSCSPTCGGVYDGVYVDS